MILLWFIGDTGRLLFYIYAELPLQFIAGGATAGILDVLVLMQYFFWKGKSIEDVALVTNHSIISKSKFRVSTTTFYEFRNCTYNWK